MKYLLDTNVFREVGTSAPHPHVVAWLATVDDSDLAISALTLREVRKGIIRLLARKPDVAKAVEARVNDAVADFGDRVLAVTQDVAMLWGELLAASEKHIDDTGLAATAQVHRLILVTRNLHHVANRGVDALDPFRSPPRLAAWPPLS